MERAADADLGGVGIFAGFAAGIAVALASGIIEWTSELGGILAGVTIVFVAGLVDDVWRLSPIAKLAAQITAAVVVLASGLNVELVGNDIIAWAIGLLWLVGITNAFNLLDNMDGLAATLAIVSCAYFAIDALTAHENETILALSIALGLACARLPPVQPAAAARSRGVHGRLRGAWLSASDSPRSRSPQAGRWVLVTEWPELADADWPAIAAAMRRPVIVDGRNMLDPDSMRAAGFHYDAIGRAATNGPR